MNRSESRGNRPAPPKPFRTALRLEALQPRLTPVVGAFAIPAPIEPDEGYDGVVSVNGGCSGSLLYTGRHVLTAAHCVDGWDGRDAVADGPVSVRFDMESGPITFAGIPASSVRVHSGYVSGFGEQDLAVITLPDIAPAGAERYGLYRSFDELNRVFSFLGYGNTGTGSPTDGPDFSDGRKRFGMNRIDSVTSGSLGADFDRGFDDGGLGGNEAMINFGDSGGPAFLDGLIAGVNRNISWDGGPAVNFGSNGGWARVSTAAGWIDARLAGSYSLVLDMNHQPGGNDGDADVIQLRRLDDRLQLLIDGEVVHDAAISSIVEVTIRGSADQDIVVVSNEPGLRVTIDGRGGNNYLVGPYHDHVDGVYWEIYGLNAGRIDPLPLAGPRIYFASMQNLIGAGSKDTFLFSHGMGVTGSIDGGYGGGDKLHYGDYNTRVEVNLEEGSATGVAYGALDRVFRIENVTGGAAADYLVGDEFDNRLRGGGGDDEIFGRAGNDHLWGDGAHDQLFGEDGVDEIFGGSGNDLLNGGHDHFRDTLEGGAGSDTFVDPQHWRAVFDLFDPLPRWTWISEDLISDLDEIVDGDRKNRTLWFD
jgi:Ca2+-binding RTX toxin-like protein